MTSLPLTSLAPPRAVGEGGAQDKTTALIITCSAMLSLAIALRVLMICTINRKLRTQAHDDPQRRHRLKLLQHALDVSVYVVLWYGISIGMTLFNKWFLRVWTGTGYPFATTMTCLNMILKCTLSRLANQCSARKMSQLPRSVYWRLAVPIGLCTSLDIMLSNLSFFYITVTFYTIVKSGANVWNLLFSIWLGHQRASFALFAVILLICSGIALASYGSTQFVVHGFILVLAASIIGTLRWVLTQSLLKEMDTSSNRILAVVYYISPASALGLLPIAVFSEGQELLKSKFVMDSHLLLQSMAFIFVSGCFAFALIFVEILLVKKTSALSLGIAGSFKDVVQVLLAVAIFGDRLSAINVCGLVVATCGMLLYTRIKHSEAHRKSRQKYSRLSGSETCLQSPGTLSAIKTLQGDCTGGLEDIESREVIDLDTSTRSQSCTTTVSSTGSPQIKCYLSGGVELTRRESKEYSDGSDEV